MRVLPNFDVCVRTAEYKVGELRRLRDHPRLSSLSMDPSLLLRLRSMAIAVGMRLDESALPESMRLEGSELVGLPESIAGYHTIYPLEMSSAPVSANWRVRKLLLKAIDQRDGRPYVLCRIEGRQVRQEQPHALPVDIYVDTKFVLLNV